ncbi:run domain Beclin-1-interacting and cysteine-rich domain-containing protein isoform X2 [Thrips palmi]|uniref:Run domain Beclin-1-interacting and cysteine-rich domain-containing protein isoform X2 n=1 Tax=Thrips palmi TaxID=161013 RepID=A0A6P8Y2C4_THRPL|nr:run domain Beclin-1-interacting and cysteine-rich domain-containing protein isoform X2 [Thrips palmi]
MAGRDEVELLLVLKGTVEGLLISQVANVWSIYGGLNRLHCAMERIFKHGFQVLSPDGEPDLWVFINGLSWLQPNLATSPTLVLESYKESSHVPQHIIKDRALTWLYKSLETHTLSQKLSWLLSDREHLLSCYKSSAFLSQEKFGEAALICLRAVEHNQPSLLTEINPCLYMTKWNPKISKTHRRCSSYPETLERHSLWAKTINKPAMGLINSRCEEGQEIDCSPPFKSELNEEAEDSLQTEDATSEVSVPLSPQAEIVKIQEPKQQEPLKIGLDKIKAWNSLPNLLDIGSSGEPNDDDAAASGKAWLLTRSNSSRSSKSHSGSQTLPSTPYRSTKSVSHRSSTAESGLVSSSNSSVVCKLSPSVIQVDYSGLQHSDSPDTPKQNRSLTLKKGHHSKQSISKSIAKNINKKGRVTKEKAAPVRDESDTEGPNHAQNLEKVSGAVQDSSDSVMKGRPKSKETAIPSKMSRSMTCDRMIPEKSPPLLSPSDTRRPESVSSIWEGSRTPSLNNAGTPTSWSRKTFMEDGGSSVQPMSTGYFPRPVEGQSLFSFLSSGQFSRANAELDRENAHFSISEAMIAAIEQVKCNKEIPAVPVQEDGADESDEEIIHLTQRLRLRRHQRQVEQRRLLWGVTLLSDGKTDTTTTDQSISPLSTSPGTPSDSISTDGVEDMELDDTQNISNLKDSGLSVSMASLYSEAELSKTATSAPCDPGNATQDSNWSAESVALSLISRFNEKQLPRASDLKWLVSEQEVDQQLLPLPKSWPVSPDEVDEDMRQATPLRGNMEWAPPRPQLIFTLHPNPVRRTLMAKQSYRCAGCGMKVAPSYASRYRYCEYLGRYFCTGCHSNQTAPIPGRVLAKWDFAGYPVSNFSYRLLESMYTDPLFNVAVLNPALYRKAKSLDRCKKLRQQLNFLKDLIFNCRFAKELQEVLEREPSYMFSEVDVYSMMDFEQVKQGRLASRLQTLYTLGNNHTSKCELCLARGFVCELCTSKEIIFPWQLTRVTRCADCGVCYHTQCLPPASCPRCKRISARKKHLETELADDEMDAFSNE